MKKTITFLSLAWLTTLFSCIKTVPFKFPRNEKDLVVNALFSPDSVFKIYVSHTVPLSEPIPPPIENAEVSLYENGVFSETLTYRNSHYYATIKPIAGNRYKIVVRAPGFQPVLAEDTVPEKPRLLQTDFIRNAGTDTDENGYLFHYSRLKCHIGDSLQKRNYYEIIILIRQWDDAAQTYRLESVVYRKNNDRIINSEQLIDYNPSSLIFSNKAFQNTNQEIDIDFYSYIVDEEDTRDFQIVIILRRISRSHYLYKKYLTLFYNSEFEDELWSSPRPVNLYSNVQNGTGIFAAFNEVRDTLNISN